MLLIPSISHSFSLVFVAFVVIVALGGGDVMEAVGNIGILAGATGLCYGADAPSIFFGQFLASLHSSSIAVLGLTVARVPGLRIFCMSRALW
jgi:hypothetical protein